MTQKYLILSQLSEIKINFNYFLLIPYILHAG